jgi:uncharacterized cupredoxin-like copper-binding protein
MFKRRNLFIAGTVIGLALIAFIGIAAWHASTGAAQTPGNAVVRVTEVAMTMKLDTAVVPAGKVTFLVVNQDKVIHEAVLLKTDKSPEALVMLSGESKVDEAALAENVGEVEVEAGTTGSVTIDLAPGKYVLICNMVEHYKAGMYSAFEVTATAAEPAAALNAH